MKMSILGTFCFHKDDQSTKGSPNRVEGSVKNIEQVLPEQFIKHTIKSLMVTRLPLLATYYEENINSNYTTDNSCHHVLVIGQLLVSIFFVTIIKCMIIQHLHSVIIQTVIVQ